MLMQASVTDTPGRSAWPGDDVLAAFLQVALDHQADDARVARGDLPGDVGGDLDLPAMLLAAVGVRDVDHHLLAQPRACAGAQAAVDVRRVR